MKEIKMSHINFPLMETSYIMNIYYNQIILTYVLYNAIGSTFSNIVMMCSSKNWKLSICHSDSFHDGCKVA